MPKPSSKRNPTLVDVARAAGVGPMTVSRTINGHPYVTPATAEKVRAAIRKLGYRPNQAARMLSGQVSKALGLVLPDVSDPFFATVSKAVQLTARQAGYTVWLADSGGDSATEKLEIEQMLHYPVDGIVVAPIQSRARHLTTAAGGTIPIVTIDRPLESTSTDSVEAQNSAGSRLAIEHLRKHSCRRIVCVATDFHLRPIKLRVSAYEERLRVEKLPTEIIVLDLDEPALPRLISLFKGRQRPDGLFTTNGDCTMRVIQALQTMQVVIGQDVALVGFDDPAFFALLRPSITAVRQPIHELGEAAVSLLLERIRGEGPAAHERIKLPTELIVRESCGCRR